MRRVAPVYFTSIDARPANRRLSKHAACLMTARQESAQVFADPFTHAVPESPRPDRNTPCPPPAKAIPSSSSACLAAHCASPAWLSALACCCSSSCGGWAATRASTKWKPIRPGKHWVTCDHCQNHCPAVMAPATCRHRARLRKNAHNWSKHPSLPPCLPRLMNPRQQRRPRARMPLPLQRPQRPWRRVTSRCLLPGRTQPRTIRPPLCAGVKAVR